ncbi:hypothetical protein PYCC9005_004030 [Savitreella phatthalungensis]
MSINLGLQRITRVLERLGGPQRRYDVIHVAGTNGKGSVCAIIAAALTSAGYRAGSFNTPHLAYPRDSVRVNNVPITAVSFAKTQRRVEAKAKRSLNAADGDLTPFESLCATAFDLLAQHKVDVSVVECGMGGRTDATNVVSPVLSVITRIGLDHQGFLGDTLTDIATHKAGIIKSGVPVVVAQAQDSPDVLNVFRQEANAKSADLTIADNTAAKDFIQQNQIVARTALQVLSERYPRLTHDVIEAALQTLPPGRFEQMDLSSLGGPATAIVDGAHNAQAWRALCGQLPANQTRAFVVALTRGKDAKDMLELIRPGDHVHAVEFEPVEGMPWVASTPATEIVQSLQQAGVESCTAHGKDVLAALAACKHEHTVICGSLYLVGQLNRMLEASEVRLKLLSDITKSRAYEPAAIERSVSEFWAGSEAPARRGPTRSFLLPPPNVTGSLHIGHALTLAVQDAYARHYAGQGDVVQWAPGTDHAGIATQSIVARQLVKQGRDPTAMTTAELTEEIWRWCDQYGDRINGQIRRLGTRLDWDREYFTLDEDRSAAVKEAIGRLWQDGLIYRAERMVNWSVGLGSVISDIETDARPIETPEKVDGVIFGKLWRIRYTAVDSTQDVIEVDTTRPETVFGDRAIAVHPEDERWSHLVGKRVHHPLLDGVTLLIIADSFVDRNFGTGAVKLTPAHDADDYAVAKRRHDVPIIPVFGKDGKMLESCGVPTLAGIDRLQARLRVVKLLQQAGALAGEQSHRMSIKTCSRSGSVVEPMLLPQWYISMEPLARRVLEQDSIRMSARTKEIWHQWLTKCQDWCISRQLVWGHRIPLWRREDDPNTWFFAEDEQAAVAKAGSSAVVQDADVLDTWFSAGLLPLSAYGWPSCLEKSSYPLTFIESGPDILFFWLARMAMLCTHLSPDNSAPFREILLHPIVRDAQGRKMSKSLGNVIDPLDVIDGVSLESMKEALASGNLSAAEVKRSSAELSRQYPAGIKAMGTDALRFALVHATVQEHYLNLDMRAVQQGRYLCGKLWNAAQFFLTHKAQVVDTDDKETHTAFDDRWIGSRVVDLAAIVDESVESRELWRAAEAIRKFVVDDLCDVFVELVKQEVFVSGVAVASKLRLLRTILLQTVAITHPFMPFVTEAIWHLLGQTESLAHHVRDRNLTLPSAGLHDSVAMAAMLQIVRAIREERDTKVHSVICNIHDTPLADSIASKAGVLRGLCNVQSLTVGKSSASGAGLSKVVAPGVIVHITRSADAQSAPPEDVQVSKRREKLTIKLQKLEERCRNKSKIKMRSSWQNCEHCFAV